MIDVSFAGQFMDVADKAVDYLSSPTVGFAGAISSAQLVSQAGAMVTDIAGAATAGLVILGSLWGIRMMIRAFKAPK